MKNQITMYQSNYAWIMDFLLLLALYGTELSPNSTSHYLDYNQDGSIDIHDLMDHLTNKPEITDP